jgi:hypothetical protein
MLLNTCEQSEIICMKLMEEKSSSWEVAAWRAEVFQTRAALSSRGGAGARAGHVTKDRRHVTDQGALIPRHDKYKTEGWRRGGIASSVSVGVICEYVLSQCVLLVPVDKHLRRTEGSRK